MSEIIFDLTRKDWTYKGVFFGEMDNAAIDKEVNHAFSTPKEYVVGVMAIIWTDEKGKFHAKMRIKFPSGNKQVVTMDFSKPEYKHINVNETFVLQQFYKMPIINKIWTPNPSGKGWSIVEIMEKLGMIESITKIPLTNSPEKEDK